MLFAVITYNISAAVRLVAKEFLPGCLLKSLDDFFGEADRICGLRFI